MGSIPIQTTVIVAQLARASDCGSEGREFDALLSPMPSYLSGEEVRS